MLDFMIYNTKLRDIILSLELAINLKDNYFNLIIYIFANN